MRRQFGIWQVVIVISCLVAIVTVTAYDPVYPAFPEASIYGAEKNGAMLITKVLPKMGIHTGVVNTNIDTWKPRSAVCLIEPVLEPQFLLAGAGSLDIQKLRVWIKQGGKLIIFGSAQAIAEAGENQPFGLFQQKPDDEGKDVNSAPLLIDEFISLHSLNPSFAGLGFKLKEPGVSLNVSTESSYTKDVKVLHFDSAPNLILNPNANNLKTHINLTKVTKDWKYLVGELSFGEGTVTIVNSAQLIYNESLLKADNAQFVYNVIANTGESVDFIDNADTGEGNETKIFSTIFFNPWGRMVIIAFLSLFALRLDSIFYFAKPMPEPKLIRRSIMEYIRAQGWTYYHAQANTLALQAVIDGIKRRMMKSYSLPALPSLQFISRKLNDLSRIEPKLQSHCQTIVAMLHRSEAGDNISTGELKTVVDILQVLEPYLFIKRQY